MNSDKDIQDAVDKIVLYRINSDSASNKPICKDFGVKYLPTFAMVNSSGAKVDRWIGYDKSEFISDLTDAMRDPTPYDEKVSRFAAKPDAKTAAALGRYNAGLVQYKDAVFYYGKAQQLRADSTTDYTFAIFQNTASGVSDKSFTFDDAKNAANNYIASPQKTDDGLQDIYSTMIQLAKSSDRQEELTKYLEEDLNLTAKSDKPDMKTEHANLMVDYAIYVKKDTASAVEYKKATMPDGWTKDPGGINEFAWWCFTMKTNLVEAEKLARNAIEISKPGKGRSNIYDTLAEIVNAKGNPAEAAEMSKKAAADDPDNKYFPKQVTRFEELAKANTK